MRSSIESPEAAQTNPTQAKPNKAVLIGALTAVVLSVGWIIYSVTRPKPAPPVGDVPAAIRYVDSIAPKLAEFEKALAQVVFTPTPDNTGVVVTGRVKSQADMQVLKRVIDGGQPKVPVENQVTIGF